MDIENDDASTIDVSFESGALDFDDLDEDGVSKTQNRPFKQHFNATIDCFGDNSTLTQIVILLNYIRFFIQNKQPGELKVEIGKHLASDAFSFSVNGEEIAQLIPQTEKQSIEIN